MFPIYDSRDCDIVVAEYNHDCLLNQIMESAGVIMYNSYDLDRQRKNLYVALNDYARGTGVSAGMLSVVADIGNGNMESILEGLCHLGELEMDLSDEGELVYRLTKFGKRWVQLFLFD
jgi:hypothetical protein